MNWSHRLAATCCCVTRSVTRSALPTSTTFGVKPTAMVRAIFEAKALLCMMAAFAVAAPPKPTLPVLAELSSQSPTVQWGRPMPTFWEIQKLSPGIREGRFEFRIGLGDREFYRLTTEEVVLSSDQQQLRWLLPAVLANPRSPEIEVQVAWLGRSGRIELGTQLLRVPTMAHRTVMLGAAAARTGERRSREWDARLSALKLEAFSPGAGSRWGDKLGVQTVVVSWEASQAPTDPFVLTAYDLIALSHDAFPQLRKPQLEALLRWVRAGGRVYVEPVGMLQPDHVEFLNGLTGAGVSGPGWTLNRVGRIEWPSMRDAGPWLVECGLGRGLVYDPTLSDAEIPRELRMQLWHLPQRITQRNFISFLAGRFLEMNPPARFGSPGVTYFPNHERPPTVDAITAQLMPASVRLVPFWVIIGALGTLVLVVGPVEWWLLGRLRLRRFTWITWPLTTVAVTVGMVAMSNAYLQATDRPQTLVVHDLDRDGAVLRTNRFRLEFPRRSRDAVAELRQSVWMPIPAMQVREETYRPGMTAVESVQHSVATFTGRVPQRYEARQAVKQWTPHLSREFSFASPDDRRPIDWSQVPLTRFESYPLAERRVPEAITSAIRKQLGPVALVAIFHESGRWACDGSEAWTTKVMSSTYVWDSVNSTTRGVIPSRRAATEWREVPATLSELLWRLTVPKRVAGQFASTWNETLLDPDLRDMPIVQSTHPQDLALVVVVPGEGETTVYRRLVKGANPTPKPTTVQRPVAPPSFGPQSLRPTNPNWPSNQPLPFPSNR